MPYVSADDINSMLCLFGIRIALGSVLGHLIFLLNINDLPNVSPDYFFILFADDTTYLTSPAKLQYAFNCIADWFQLKSCHSV